MFVKFSKNSMLYCWVLQCQKLHTFSFAFWKWNASFLAKLWKQKRWRRRHFCLWPLLYSSDIKTMNYNNASNCAIRLTKESKMHIFFCCCMHLNVFLSFLYKTETFARKTFVLTNNEQVHQSLQKFVFLNPKVRHLKFCQSLSF